MEKNCLYVHCKLVKRNLLFKNCAKIVNLYNRALDEATINSSSPNYYSIVSVIVLHICRRSKTVVATISEYNKPRE